MNMNYIKYINDGKLKKVEKGRKKWSSRRIIIPNKVEESGSRRRRTGRGWLVAWVIRIITPHSIHLPVQPEDIKGKKQRRVEVRIVISVSAPTNTRTMAVQSNNSSFFLTKSASPAIFPWSSSSSWKKKMMNPASVVNVASSSSSSTATNVWLGHKDRIDGGFGGRSKVRLAFALGGSSSSSSSSSNSNISSSNSRGGGGGTDGSNKNKGPAGVPSSNYVVPLDKSLSSSYLSSIMRPLAEILRDLNKRIPDNIIKPSPSVPHQSHSSTTPVIPWYHANRMLSFYAPGWCGEVRDVIFSEDGSVTVVYRVTIRGSDGEAHRESSGTISSSDVHSVDPVAAAEEIAFCRACARFGLGLYMYHEE